MISQAQKSLDPFKNLQETELTRSIFTVARLSGFVPGESPHNWLVMGETNSQVVDIHILICQGYVYQKILWKSIICWEKKEGPSMNHDMFLIISYV